MTDRERIREQALRTGRRVKEVPPRHELQRAGMLAWERLLAQALAAAMKPGVGRRGLRGVAQKSRRSSLRNLGAPLAGER